MVNDPGSNKENNADQLPSTFTSQSPLTPVNFEALNVRKRKQTDIVQYVPKKMAFDTQKKIDDALLKMFTKDFQTFKMVEDEGF